MQIQFNDTDLKERLGNCHGSSNDIDLEIEMKSFFIEEKKL